MMRIARRLRRAILAHAGEITVFICILTLLDVMLGAYVMSTLIRTLLGSR